MLLIIIINVSEAETTDFGWQVRDEMHGVLQGDQELGHLKKGMCEVGEAWKQSVSAALGKG